MSLSNGCRDGCTMRTSGTSYWVEHVDDCPNKPGNTDTTGWPYSFSGTAGPSDYYLPPASFTVTAGGMTLSTSPPHCATCTCPRST